MVNRINYPCGRKMHKIYMRLITTLHIYVEDNHKKYLCGQEASQNIYVNTRMHRSSMDAKGHIEPLWGWKPA